jgi:hypothetical protein
VEASSVTEGMLGSSYESWRRIYYGFIVLLKVEKRREEQLTEEPVITPAFVNNPVKDFNGSAVRHSRKDVELLRCSYLTSMLLLL